MPRTKRKERMPVLRSRAACLRRARGKGRLSGVLPSRALTGSARVASTAAYTTTPGRGRKVSWPSFPAVAARRIVARAW